MACVNAPGGSGVPFPATGAAPGLPAMSEPGIVPIFGGSKPGEEATVKVRDLMTRKVLSVRADDALGLAFQMMQWTGIRHLPVVRGDQVVGVLSDRDVLRASAEHEEGMSAPVVDAMSHPPQTASPEDELSEAAARMTVRKLGCLPVVKDERLVGILTVTDVLAERARHHFPTDEEAAPPVDAVMSHPPVTCEPDDYLLDAAGRMALHGVRHLPVIDSEGTVVGIVSDRDLRTAIGDPRRTLEEREARTKVQSMRVSHVMTGDPITVRSGTTLTHAVAHFLDERIGALPVVDDTDHLIGVLSYVDVLRHLAGKRETPLAGAPMLQ